jgi:hypothetical protein
MFGPDVAPLMVSMPGGVTFRFLDRLQAVSVMGAVAQRRAPFLTWDHQPPAAVGYQ